MKIERGFGAVLLLVTGCAASHDECQTWWEAAVRADECSVVVPATPPVDGREDVTCAPEEELAAGGAVSGYDECVEYLEAHADSCTPLSLDDPRVHHRRGGVVGTIAGGGRLRAVAAARERTRGV